MLVGWRHASEVVAQPQISARVQLAWFHSRDLSLFLFLQSLVCSLILICPGKIIKASMSTNSEICCAPRDLRHELEQFASNISLASIPVSFSTSYQCSIYNAPPSANTSTVLVKTCAAPISSNLSMLSSRASPSESNEQPSYAPTTWPPNTTHAATANVFQVARPSTQQQGDDENSGHNRGTAIANTAPTVPNFGDTPGRRAPGQMPHSTQLHLSNGESSWTALPRQSRVWEYSGSPPPPSPPTDAARVRQPLAEIVNVNTLCPNASSRPLFEVPRIVFRVQDTPRRPVRQLQVRRSRRARANHQNTAPGEWLRLPARRPRLAAATGVRFLAASSKAP